MNDLPGLADTLAPLVPDLRGRLAGDAPLAQWTWFRVGGPAEVLFEPEDDADLAYFLKRIPAHIPIFVLGLASNVLVRDGGIPGIVVRLGKAFSKIAVEGERHVRAGSGAPDVKVARAAAEAGIAGLAFLRGVPGGVGGALRMNAGAYGREIKDIFVEARAFDRHGKEWVLSAADMGFGYRHTQVAHDIVFVDALFAGEPGDRAAIQQEMDRVTAERGDTQPVNTRTGGSTFANPPGMKAWELIDAAGCRGLSIGGAQVSEKHCNFLINTGGATAAELEELGETVRRRVKETSGVTLDWEIRRIGVSLDMPVL